jgi:hypothetical protein
VDFQAAAAGMGDPSLQAAIAQRPACWHQATGATVASAGMWNEACGPLRKCNTVTLLLAWEEPSLQAVGALRPTFWCQLPGATATAAGLGEPVLQGVGVLGPHSWLGAQFSDTVAFLGEPSLLLPMEQQEPWVSWHFRVKLAGPVVGGSTELHVPVCTGKQDLTAECMETSGWGIRSMCFELFSHSSCG